MDNFYQKFYCDKYHIRTRKCQQYKKKLKKTKELLALILFEKTPLIVLPRAGPGRQSLAGPCFVPTNLCRYPIF